MWGHKRGAMNRDKNGVKISRLRKAASVCNWIQDRAYGEYEKLLADEVRERSLPEHVAIIMDGNRRYAKKIGISTEDGYLYGAEITEQAIEWCFEAGVKQLTIYAFSIENFCRSDEEKERLFKLMRQEFEKISKDERVHKRGVRVKAIGNLNLLPDSVKEAIQVAERETAHYNSFMLFIAVAYSGRMEIVDSVRIIADMVKRGALSVDEIDNETISKHLYISEIEVGDSDSGAKASVDLIIRTGGEMRLSNFVPWQALGNECAAYFCAPFWPEFRKIDLLRAIRTYQEREMEQQQRTTARILKLKHFLERKSLSKKLAQNESFIKEEEINC
ncbi:tritrans,polycis-undecaprenyl-diphosphate synthase [geranylgeranyl-diphosphate specific] [Methanophagales archaeon]|nr:tritrans,polycis-undecaprenyl-diphosphate synthase [geranylgeranyl-diphosphate specific] [Methanophagales archaeon]